MTISDHEDNHKNMPLESTSGKQSDCSSDTAADKSYGRVAMDGARWTATSAVAGLVLQLIQLSVMGRLLTPKEFGLMAMMTVVIGFTGLLADCGIFNFIIQTKNLTGAVLGCILIVVSVVSLSLAGIVTILTPAVANYYRTPMLVHLLPVASLTLVVNAVGQPFYALLQRNMRFKAVALADILSGLTGLIVSIVLAVLQKGIWSLILGQLVTIASKSIVSYICARSLLVIKFNLNFRDIKSALRFGGFQMGERVAGYSCWNIDKLIVGRFLGEGPLGIYSIAFQLIQRPFMIINPILTRVALPIFAGIQDKDDQLKKYYLLMLQVLSTLGFPICAVLIVSSDFIVNLLLGPQWYEASTVVSILGVFSFVIVLGNPIGSLLLAKGRADLGFYFVCIAAMTYLLSVLVFSRYGISGVAFAYVFAAFVVLMPLEFYLRWKLVGMKPSEYFNTLKVNIFAVTCAIATGFLLRNLIFPAGVGFQLVVLLSTLSVFYSIVWFFEKDHVKFLYSMFRNNK